MAIESEHYIYILFPHYCKTTIFEWFPIATFDYWRSYDHIIYDLRCSNRFMKRIVTCLSSAARLQDCIGIHLIRSYEATISGKEPITGTTTVLQNCSLKRLKWFKCLIWCTANCFRILARHRLRGVHRKHKMKRTLWLQCKAINLAAMSDTSWGCQSVEDKRCTSDAGLSFVEMRYRKYRPDVVCLG